jgi:transposase
MKTRKLRIYPNQEQRKKLKEWFDTTRYVYNKGVHEIKINGNQSFMSLRNKLVTSKGNDLNQWELDVPKDVRAGSLRDLDKARKTAFTNLEQVTIQENSLHSTIFLGNTNSRQVKLTNINTNEEIKFNKLKDASDYLSLSYQSIQENKIIKKEWIANII